MVFIEWLRDGLQGFAARKMI